MATAAKQSSTTTQIKRKILNKYRHRCAACSTPTPLEQANFIPWRRTTKKANRFIKTDSILIVTTTEVEAQTVLRVAAEASKEEWTSKAIGSKTYYDLGIHGGAPVFMVQSEMGSSGPFGSQSTINQAIDDLHPQVIIMCGIAFGLVMSGEKLIKSSAFRASLLEMEPEAIGGEMEGAGLYTAAYEKKVDWILVKAITDWADETKNDGAHLQAAENAARFVLHVIKIGGWKYEEKNLICLCDGCYEKVEHGKLDEKTLKNIKNNPDYISKYKNGSHIPDKVAKVELTINMELKDFDNTNKRWLQYALAAFLDIAPELIQVTKVVKSSVKAILELPNENAKQLLSAYKEHDINLLHFLNPLDLKDLEIKDEEPRKPGLRTILHNCGLNWYPVINAAIIIYFSVIFIILEYSHINSIVYRNTILIFYLLFIIPIIIARFFIFNKMFEVYRNIKGSMNVSAEKKFITSFFIIDLLNISGVLLPIIFYISQYYTITLFKFTSNIIIDSIFFSFCGILLHFLLWLIYMTPEAYRHLRELDLLIKFKYNLISIIVFLFIFTVFFIISLFQSTSFKFFINLFIVISFIYLIYKFFFLFSYKEKLNNPLDFNLNKKINKIIILPEFLLFGVWVVFFFILYTKNEQLPASVQHLKEPKDWIDLFFFCFILNSLPYLIYTTIENVKFKEEKFPFVEITGLKIKYVKDKIFIINSIYTISSILLKCILTSIVLYFV